MRKLIGSRPLVVRLGVVAVVLASVSCGSESTGASDDQQPEQPDEADTVELVLLADVEDPSETHDAADVIERRLQALGIDDARVEVDRSRIHVTYRGDDGELVRLALTGAGELEFRPVLAFEGQLDADADPTIQLTAPDERTPDREVVLASEDGVVYRLGPVEVHGSAVETATASNEHGESWSIHLAFRDGTDGIGRFNELASLCYDARPDVCPGLSLPESGSDQRGLFAVVVDGTVVSAPAINEQSFERDQIQVSGSFDRNEAMAVAAAIQAGASPVTWTIRD